MEVVFLLVGMMAKDCVVGGGFIVFRLRGNFFLDWTNRRVFRNWVY